MMDFEPTTALIQDSSLLMHPTIDMASFPFEALLDNVDRFGGPSDLRPALPASLPGVLDHVNHLSGSLDPVLPHCGSFAPHPSCSPPSDQWVGESVVITITPLSGPSSSHHHHETVSSPDSSSSTTSSVNGSTSGNKGGGSSGSSSGGGGGGGIAATRIVTCYCGASCSCPGCLVHPGNFFLGNQTLDPYAGFFPSYQVANSSSTASSCYGSDEEEQKLF
ncbi:hypothetical protein J3Q64DRAFT_1746106 [Phycomyces blakesleeanus]|uniref:Copper-fist domain-containing protein n=1 Tax=Phycomyces blakesleeanus TaxID=4837 RepID=A0ABR3B048_PHYBL